MLFLTLPLADIFKILVWYLFKEYHSHAVLLLYLCQYVAKRWENIFGDVALIVIGLGGAKTEVKRGRGIVTRRFHRKT